MTKGKSRRKVPLDKVIQRANDKRKALGLNELDLLLTKTQREESVNCGSLGRVSLAFYKGTMKNTTR